MKATKKMFLSLLMAMLVSVLFGTVSMAASSTVAKIGSKEYSSLSAAFSAADNGSTIVLQKNTSISKVATLNKSGKKVTLDLNGYTLTCKKSAYLDVKNGTLTIKNGTIKKSGASFDSVEDKVASTILVAESGGTVKISSGTYTGEIINNGSMTISGGTFSPAKAIVYDSTYGMGNVISNKGTMTIKGGKFKATTKNVSAYYGKLVTNEGTLKITKGTFKSTAGLHLYNTGKLTVSGGTFTASGINVSSTSGVIVNDYGTSVIKGGTFTSGDCLSVLLDWYGKVTISGGTFLNNSSTGKCVTTNGGKITIKGGAYKSTDDCIVSYPYGVNGVTQYGKVTISDGTFTATGANAVLLYASDGASIKVTGGAFTAANGYKYAQIKSSSGKKGKVTISGGSFTTKYGEYTE